MKPHNMTCKAFAATWASGAQPPRPARLPRLASPAVPLAMLIAGLAAANAARAWTPAMHVEIARQAATIAPPDLFRQIQRHEKFFSAGLASSIAGENHSDEGGALLSRVRSGSNSIVEAIEAHRPFRDVVRDLGRLAVYAAEANNPLDHSDDDPGEERYRRDYETYVASTVPRLQVVFYGEGRDLRTEADLTRMLSATERRGATLYPLLGREYRRIGSIDGVGLFDDKSTAFGVGSIAFSHAVSDLAAIYRYIWLRSGGADPRDLPITAPTALSANAAAAAGAGGVRVR